MSFYKNKKSGYGGLVSYNNPEGTTVQTAYEKTRQQILDLFFVMNEKVSSYITSGEMERLPSDMRFTEHEAFKAIRELYALVKNGCISWVEQLEKHKKKLESAANPVKNRIEDLDIKIKHYKQMLLALDNMQYGLIPKERKDIIIVNTADFLGQYIYGSGLTRLESQKMSVNKEYALQAYGEDIDDDEED